MVMGPRVQEGGEIASMSLFIDFILSQHTNRVQVVADHRRNQHNPATDFYRPLREAVIEASKNRRRPRAGIFSQMLSGLGDARAEGIFPPLIKSYEAFLEANPGTGFFPPLGGLLPVGPANPRLSIGINPELGLTIRGVPHHLKLWFRRDELTQRRVDVTIALMSRLAPPPDHRIAMLDVRKGEVFYLSEKSIKAVPWRKLDALITGEAAAYGTLWGIV